LRAYFALNSEKALADLDAKRKGLSQREAERRLKEFGPNRISEEKRFSQLWLFFSQFSSPLVYILLIAGLTTLFLREWTDAVVIFLAVFVNVLVGFWQEKKAQGTLRELKRTLKLKALVLRGGKRKEILQEEIVPGDILVLSPGEKVGADARLIEAEELRVNEAILTGEWLAAKKNTKKLSYDTPLADRANMVFMGTTVESGKGRALVVATAEATEFGKITKLIKKTKEERTPYQKKLAKFARFIALATLLIALVIFIEGLISGESFAAMFTLSVAIAVAAIPEGLPVAMTVILALSMVRILKRKGLVRRLNSAETLGSTSVICADKTGTITEAKMKLKGIIAGKKEKRKALSIAALRSEVYPKEKGILGRPTDRALFLAAQKRGIFKKELLKREPKIDEIPFESKNKFSASLHKFSEKELILYLMGAPELILEKAKKIELNGKIFVLKGKRLKRLAAKHEGLEKRGFRVLAVAYRRLKTAKLTLESEQIQDLVFVGFLALEDPIRRGVKKSIRLSQKAGIKPIIITGDHILTAKSVAREIGLPYRKKNVMEGKDLEMLSQRELREKIGKISVFARISPEQKLNIVQALQKRGEVVAMTGDGINDAPALKRADIGVAVGSGTSAAKETSDLVLLKNNFSVITAAVEEGRAIIDNIRKVITYLLADSFTEIILVGGALLLGLPLPITAVQILWVNLIEDGLPNAALAFEKKESDLLQRRPEKKEKPLLTVEMKVIIFAVGLFTDLILFLIFFWLYRQGAGLNYVRTMIFAALTIDSLFYVFSCKNLHKNIWQINIFSNKFLIFAWAAGFLMLIFALYLPPLQLLLKTVPLHLSDWFLILGLGILNLILIEGVKWIFIKKSNIKNQISKQQRKIQN